MSTKTKTTPTLNLAKALRGIADDMSGNRALVAAVALTEASNRLFALELERDALKARIAQLEEAVGLAMKMRRDWLEMSDEGYIVAYEAFVENNDGEWDKIAKAMEQAPVCSARTIQDYE